MDTEIYYGLVWYLSTGEMPDTLNPETQNLLATNAHGTHGARVSARLDFTHLDAVPQHALDNLLWESVHGRRSKPPAPGPNAVRGHDAAG